MHSMYIIFFESVIEKIRRRTAPSSFTAGLVSRCRTMIGVKSATSRRLWAVYSRNIPSVLCLPIVGVVSKGGRTCILSAYCPHTLLQLANVVLSMAWYCSEIPSKQLFSTSGIGQPYFLFNRTSLTLHESMNWVLIVASIDESDDHIGTQRYEPLSPWNSVFCLRF